MKNLLFDSHVREEEPDRNTLLFKRRAVKEGYMEDYVEYLEGVARWALKQKEKHQ